MNPEVNVTKIDMIHLMRLHQNVGLVEAKTLIEEIANRADFTFPIVNNREFLEILKLVYSIMDKIQNGELIYKENTLYYPIQVIVIAKKENWPGYSVYSTLE